jgi:hypothetical protein
MGLSRWTRRTASHCIAPLACAMILQRTRTARALQPRAKHAACTRADVMRVVCLKRASDEGVSIDANPHSTALAATNSAQSPEAVQTRFAMEAFSCHQTIRASRTQRGWLARCSPSPCRRTHPQCSAPSCCLRCATAATRRRPARSAAEMEISTVSRAHVCATCHGVSTMCQV